MITPGLAVTLPREEEEAPSIRRCRFCDNPLSHTMVDLGMSPLCERFLRADQLDDVEPFFPLRVQVCERCLLVQLPSYVAPETIFGEYAYFSSFSTSWLNHARAYAVRMTADLGLDGSSLVIEVGSNDGYLLGRFRELGVPVLGIEPARNVAAAAAAAGVPTRVEFFGRDVAHRLRAEGLGADLLVGNNVLAQVPDLNDFVAGLREILNVGGLLTLEFPSLEHLIASNQFDTIYHEHFSYFSLGTARRILEAHGLAVVDVEELPTHGGSLRVFARRIEDAAEPTARSTELVDRERSRGLDGLSVYEDFGRRVETLKHDLLEFLIDARREGLSVAGYGAPGKANTLLNYCGIRTDLLPYTVDRNPYKHGRFTPGTHIPILAPDDLLASRPDIVWILPWNLVDEIVAQLEPIRGWGGRFLVAIPGVRVIA